MTNTANNIKGITVEINGETKGLQSALKDVNKEAKTTSAELREVEKGLKLDPTNVTLLAQKNQLLANAVAIAKDKLNSLQAAQEQVEKQFANGDIGESQYRAFQRELIQSENSLQSLEDQLQNSNRDLLEFGRNGAAAAEAQRDQADAAEQNKGKQEKLNDQIGQGEKALGKWKTAAEKVKQAGEFAFNAVKKAAVGTGAAIAAGATAAVAAYKDVREGTENVIKATGATGGALDGLNASYKKVVESVAAANKDFGDVGSVLGEVNTRFGFTDEKLENCTEKFLKFADLSGGDAVTAVQLVSRAMGDASIPAEEYGDVLDALTVAAQASGIGMDKLTDNLTKYGAPMRALGFDTKESIAIFSSWEKSGVNTEIAFSGMKAAIGKWSKEGKDAREEFKKTLEEIKACPDIATATGKSIEAFGQKAGPDLADAIQGGRFEYEDFLDLLNNSGGAVDNTFNETVTGADKLKSAFNGLKVQASNAGEAISETAGEYAAQAINKISEIVGSIDPDFVKNIIENYVKPAIESVKKKVSELIQFIKKADIKSMLDKLKTLIKGVADAVGKLIKWVIDNKDIVIAALAGIAAGLLAFNVVTMIQGLVAAFKAWQIATEGMTVAQKLLNLVMSLNPIGLIIAGIAALVAAFIVLWNKCDWFREFWIGLWDQLKAVLEIFKAAFEIIVDAIKKIFNALKEHFEAKWEEIKTVFSLAGGWLKDTFGEMFSQAMENIKTVFNAVKDFIADRWENIKNIFSNIIDFVKNVFQGNWSEAWDNIKNIFKSVWEGFVDIAKAPLNSVLGLVNGLISGINLLVDGINGINVTIPNWIPGIGGNSIGFDIPHVPDIEYLAKGGTMLQGRAVVGEAGPELLTMFNGKTIVQPLSNDKLRSVDGGNTYNITNVVNVEKISSDYDVNRIDEQLAFRQAQRLAAVGGR